MADTKQRIGSTVEVDMVEVHFETLEAILRLSKELRQKPSKIVASWLNEMAVLHRE